MIWPGEECWGRELTASWLNNHESYRKEDYIIYFLFICLCLFVVLKTKKTGKKLNNG